MLEVTLPREGLPLCRSHARFDGRRATMIDTAMCSGGHAFQEYSAKRLYVIAGHEKRPGDEPDPHGYHYWFYRRPLLVDLFTDDPDEAQAAFERGAEWVRTGHIS